jgi:hypothetical protein
LLLLGPGSLTRGTSTAKPVAGLGLGRASSHLTPAASAVEPSAPLRRACSDTSSLA